MEYLSGVAFSLLVAGAASAIGFDRDRSFYPTVLAVIALLYVLFEAMAASTQVLALETLIAIGFLVLSIIGFKTSLWLVVAAIAGHGVFDLIHHTLIHNPGVPAWWPGFCLVVDLVLAAALARLLLKRTPQSLGGSS